MASDTNVCSLYFCARSRILAGVYIEELTIIKLLPCISFYSVHPLHLIGTEGNALMLHQSIRLIYC